MSETEGSIVKELEELEEKSKNQESRRIGLLISVLAIILAICGALGRKAENHVIVSRVDASNTWAYYQAKKERGFISETTGDLVQLISNGANASQKHAAEELLAHYKSKKTKYEEESKELAEKAEGYSQTAEAWERRAGRLTYSEIFLQISVVLCSIAILVGSRIFVYSGLVFSMMGILALVASLAGL